MFRPKWNKVKQKEKKADKKDHLRSQEGVDKKL